MRTSPTSSGFSKTMPRADHRLFMLRPDVTRIPADNASFLRKTNLSKASRSVRYTHGKPQSFTQDVLLRRELKRARCCVRSQAENTEGLMSFYFSNKVPLCVDV